MEVVSYTAKGQRKSNEDFLLYREFSQGESLFLLADGMGGYSYGEIAASLACETIAHTIESNLGKISAVELIIQAVSDSNNAILEKRQELAEKMGTTIAGILIENDTVYYFWLGDVRIYHFRNNKIFFRSTDHSLINEMKQNRQISAIEIERYKNIVTRHLSGSVQEYEVPVISSNLMTNDMIILCSDGLWQNWDINYLKDLTQEELENTLSVAETTNNDNYTIIRTLI